MGIFNKMLVLLSYSVDDLTVCDMDYKDATTKKQLSNIQTLMQ